MRLPRAVGAALLGGLAASLLASGLALAHAELVSSTPAANASVLESPSAVTMTFSEPIDPASASVQLLDDLQHAVAGLGTVQVDASGLVASLGVPTLEPSVYTVSYRVTSAIDGHVSAGTWAFLVDPTGSLPPPTIVAQSSSPSGDALTITARWLALAAALTLLGLAIFWAVSARPVLARSTHDPAAPWAVIAVTAAVAFAALAAYLTLAARPFVEASAGHPGHGGSGALPLDFAAPFGATPFATAMRLAEVGAGAAFLLATARWLSVSEARQRIAASDRNRDPIALLLVGVAAAIGLAGASLAGHASANGGLLFATIDWLHLLAVAAWIGTLPGLLLLARRSHRFGAEGRQLLGDTLARHSRLAMAAAPIVVLTGIANSPLVLGEARGLVGSAYGNVLLAKVLLFSIAAALGSVNFFLIKGRAFRRTVPLIAIELVLGALAVLAASNLVTTEPAAGREPVLTRSAIGTLHLYGQAGASTVHAAVILPAPGQQHYQVSVADAASGDVRTDVDKVILVFIAPVESGLRDERVELTQGAAPWLWASSGAYTPIVGDWRLDVLVLRAGGHNESATFDLPVSQPLPPAVVQPADTGFGVPTPLAWVWLALPRGSVGWLVPIGLLLGFAGVSAVERRRGGTRRGLLPATRVALAALVVVSGLGMGSRAAAEVANQAPSRAAAETNPIGASPASTARGRDLYLANCAACHGISGAGDGLTAAGLLPGPGDLSSRVPALTDGELAYLIASGTVATRMPSFSITLSENDRWDLVNYLRSAWPRVAP